MMKVEIALTPADGKSLSAELPSFVIDSSFLIADLLLMLFALTTRMFQIGNSIPLHPRVSVAVIIETEPPMRTVCQPDEWPTPNCALHSDFEEAFDVRNLEMETVILYAGLTCYRVCSLHYLRSCDNLTDDYEIREMR